MRALSEKLWVTTDDGSYGRKGLVTDELRRILDEGLKIDRVMTIGPPIMMQAVCKLTETYGLKTMVSLDSIMRVISVPWSVVITFISMCRISRARYALIA